MKKPATHAALFILVLFALIPPIYIVIANPSFEEWPLMILAAGFLGFFTLWIRVHWAVKAIAIGSFFLCFFSSGPYIAFTSYVSIVFCCYLYILCTKIEDWRLVFKAFHTLLLLNLFLIGMQWLGADSLLNFGLGHDLTGFGIIGQHMQMGSFSVVLSAILLPLNPLCLMFPFMVAFFCTSTWTILAAGTGVFILCFPRYKRWAVFFAIAIAILFFMYGGSHHKFYENLNGHSGRWEVWKRSIELANERPLTGWGAGSYKVLFPAFNLQAERYIPYKNAHNAFIQLAFEMGYPFTLFIMGLLGGLMIRLYRAREMYCLAGLVMILTDSLVHFPDRMLQTVGLIICFLAYCNYRLNQKILR